MVYVFDNNDTNLTDSCFDAFDLDFDFVDVDFDFDFGSSFSLLLNNIQLNRLLHLTLLPCFDETASNSVEIWYLYSSTTSGQLMSGI